MDLTTCGHAGWAFVCRGVRWLFVCTAGLFAVTACVSSVQPVAKIGLLAPFEGLYRESGYASLAAQRNALKDCPNQNVPVPAVQFLPVALDISGGAELLHRSAAKLLVDPAVVAIVGPYDPAQAVAISTNFETAESDWFLPLAVGGDPNADEIDVASSGMLDLVRAVAALAKEQGAPRLLVGMPTPLWPKEETNTQLADVALPVQVLDQLSALAQASTNGDAVLWLGPPDQGAELATVLGQNHDRILFWLGPQGGDPVFAARVRADFPIYWAVWQDDGYNEWAKLHSFATPAAYLTYRATCRALYAASGLLAPTSSWHIQSYQLEPEGVSRAYRTVP